MKKILTEDILYKAIAKSIKKNITESYFGNGYNTFETKKEDGRLSDMNSETKKEEEYRDSIENFFKKPGVNNAPYAYSLYNVEQEKGKDTNDMKNARKKFADCVNHATNQNGYPYSFTSSELNKLKGMISNSQLSEAVNKSIRNLKKKFK